MTTMLERAARAVGDIQVGVDESGEAVFAGPHVGLAIARAALMAVRIKDPANLADQILNERIDAILNDPSQ